MDSLLARNGLAHTVTEVRSSGTCLNSGADRSNSRGAYMYASGYWHAATARTIGIQSRCTSGLILFTSSLGTLDHKPDSGIVVSLLYGRDGVRIIASPLCKRRIPR